MFGLPFDYRRRVPWPAHRRETYVCPYCKVRRVFRIRRGLDEEVLECNGCGGGILAFADAPPIAVDSGVVALAPSSPAVRISTTFQTPSRVRAAVGHPNSPFQVAPVALRQLPTAPATAHKSLALHGCCDGCHKKIVGTAWYRCSSCRPNYDLCSDCHRRQHQLHPGHVFQVIDIPTIRCSPAFLFSLLNGSPAFDFLRVIKNDFDVLVAEIRSDDPRDVLTLWLKDEKRCADINWLRAQSPAWTCGICMEGLQEEHPGRVIQLCKETSAAQAVPNCRQRQPPVCSRTPPACANGGPALQTSAGDAKSNQDHGSAASSSGKQLRNGCGHGHMFHEACLRKWLMLKNSCPICRREPAISFPRGPGLHVRLQASDQYEF